MPLASLFTLQYYGPCAAAIVVEGGSSGVELLAPKIKLRAALDVISVGIIEKMRPVKLFGSPLSVTGLGIIEFLQPRLRLRMALDVKIGTLTQDDVTGAVLDTPIEGNYTLRQLLRLMSSVLVGKVSGANTNTEVFRDINDTVNRVTSTVDENGNRTVVVKNVT